MKNIFLALLLAGGVFVFAPSVQAVYVDPITHDPITSTYTQCVLTPDPAQKNATTVYTLNITLTNWIESEYYRWWGRYARCDELQFHAEHNTTKDRLTSWLAQVQIQRYQNHEYDGLMASYSQGNWGNARLWRLINGKRQRVYDWPTQMAWGFASNDRRSAPIWLTNQFLAAYEEIEPLDYWDGPYKDQVNAMWHEGDIDPDVPERLRVELIQHAVDWGFFRYRDACSQFMRGCSNIYDWTWLYDNPCIWNNNDPQCDG